MFVLSVLFQDTPSGGPSGRLILGVLVAAWLLGLGALLIHLVRINGSSGSSPLFNLAKPKRRSTNEINTEIQAPPLAHAAPPTGMHTTGTYTTAVHTTVVPAATASPPTWDRMRNSWVTEHPEFGALVLNTATNRWHPLSA